MTSNSFIFTWQNLHYYSSLQCTVLSSAETAALPLALLKVLQADGASTVAQCSGHRRRREPEQAERRRRRRAHATPRARILEQTGAALGGNFLQNSCVAPNRCRFASNSKKTNKKFIITLPKKPSAKT